MQSLVFILLLISLLFLAYQDFKDRAISWWILPLIVLLYVFYYQQFNLEYLINIGSNIAFIMLNYLIITLYFSVKNKKIVNVLDQYLGIGDLLFFLVCAVMFSFPNFIVFLSLSFLVAIFVHLVMFLVKKRTNPQIPLAGIMSLVLVGVFLIDLKSAKDLFHDVSCFESLIV